MENGEVRVGKPLSQFQGVLTGVPRLLSTLGHQEDGTVTGD
jgi:hypothetical protein